MIDPASIAALVLVAAWVRWLNSSSNPFAGPYYAPKALPARVSGDSMQPDALGFSLRKIASKAKNVAKAVARSTVKAANPLTAAKLARQIVTHPTQVRKNLSQLAQLDPGIRTAVAVTKALRKPATQPRAVAALRTATAQAKAGNPQAAKVVLATRNLTAAMQAAQPAAALEPQNLPDYGAPAYVPADYGAPPAYDAQPAYEPEPAYYDEEPAYESEPAYYDEEPAYEEDPYDLMGWLPPEYAPGPGVDVLGFSLNFRKAIKSIPWRKVSSVAQKVGVGIAAVYPPAAPFVAAGIVVLKAAERGDAAALAKIAAVKAGANDGNKDAAAALAALETAQTVIKQAKAAA